MRRIILACQPSVSGFTLSEGLAGEFRRSSLVVDEIREFDLAALFGRSLNTPKRL